LYAELPYAVWAGWPSWVTGLPDRPYLVPEARWRADLTGAPVPFEQWRPEVVALSTSERAAKVEAVEAYETQFAALNAGPLDRMRHPEIIGFEVSWSIP
jgi:hypothetical protein